ncbi:hypothetical protein GCM10022243_68260 [Saccharothrix violaceirubra]|uniref:Uncharacterized protein n=1 Tax=Saccharothrix violaceirubra TaxID=413306 RepID=A0A7W7WXL0_9PSEU|nr:hypothetical protein [Saccharothrix violaceirubra]MBB4967232.1 hypothetical protein [Saccharothrix violaceirubra]
MRTFAKIALIVGLTATGYYVYTGLTGTDEFAWLNGWLIAPVLLLTVVPILFSLSAFRRSFGESMAALRGDVPAEFAGAPIGMGTVVSTARTGLSINDQPQLDIVLDVDTPEGRGFRAVARHLVDLTELGAVQPGAVLPVRYLPDGRVVLAVDAPAYELQAALDRIQLAKGHITPKQLHIAENGLDAQAVVLAMNPTGEVRAGRAVIVLTLRVTRPDGTRFDVTQEKTVPPGALGQVQPGAVVRAKYLPYDESEVTLLVNP